MRLIVHREIPTDAQLGIEWDCLVDEMERPEVFYTYEWALAVHRAYGATVTPLLMLLYDDERLVGLASLATSTENGGIFFLANTTADYCDFVSHPGKRAELVNFVFLELQKLDLGLLTLANFPADSASLAVIQKASCDNGYSIFSRPAYLCAQIRFPSSDERESVAKEARGKQMVKRHLKSLGKIGPVALTHRVSRESIDEALPEFIRAHVERFLAAGRISNLASPGRYRFLVELSRLLSKHGWAALSCLTVGERAAAWNYGFRFRGSWFWYQPCFDTALQLYWPGYCLLAKIVQDACADPEINLVDLGLGAEEYKERFANAGRQTLHMTISTSKLECLRAKARYVAAETVNSIPHLSSAVRNILSRSVSIKSHMRQEGRLRWLGRRCKQAFSRADVDFFAWKNMPASGIVAGDEELRLKPVDMGVLADAAIKYARDDETLTYLIRGARRLNGEQGCGFALITNEGVPVHFCWVTESNSFHLSEIDYTLASRSSAEVLIFDCWTPMAVRGRGYYSKCISLCARHLVKSGEDPWIFSASSNVSSLRGIVNAGFTRMFSLTRKRPWLMNAVKRSQI